MAHGDRFPDDRGDHDDDHGNDHDDDQDDERGDEHDAHDPFGEARGVLPDPLDRLWRHPAELPVPVVPFGSTSSRRRRPAWAAPLVAGAAGALLTVGVLALTGTIGRSSSRKIPATAANVSTPTMAVQQVLGVVGGSVIAIVARDTHGVRRGSGVCVQHADELLTTARLVGDATTVDVYTADGVRHDGHVVGRDRTTDIALVSIGGDLDVPAAQLARRAPSTGEHVWIVANEAAGRPQWIGGGMLSSDDTLLALDGGPTTTGLVEVDTSAGKGEGGALVDADGAVGGIVLGTGDGQGSTYAIPIARALSIANEMRDNGGVVKHGSLGLDLASGTRGPTIIDIAPRGPAARAGMKTGDVVVSVDNHPVESVGEVMAVIRGDEPGANVVVELQRGATSLKVSAVLSAIAG